MRQSEFVSAMEWTHDEILLFIDDYRNSELLWDPRVPDYKDNKKKTTVIRNLAKKYNVTEDFIRKKIKNLRSAFHREHKTLMMQRKSHRQTKAKWFAYESLSFLLEIDPTKTEFSTEEYHSSEDEDEPSVVKSEPITETEESFYSSNIEYIPFKAPESQPQKKKKVDILPQESAPEEEYHVFKESLNKDEMYIYGEYVANEIRKMKSRTQTIVKHLINNILFDGAMGKYDEASTCEQFGDRRFPSIPFHQTQAGPSRASTSKRKGEAEL